MACHFGEDLFALVIRFFWPKSRAANTGHHCRPSLVQRRCFVPLQFRPPFESPLVRSDLRFGAWGVDVPAWLHHKTTALWSAVSNDTADARWLQGEDDRGIVARIFGLAVLVLILGCCCLCMCCCLGVYCMYSPERSRNVMLPVINYLDSAGMLDGLEKPVGTTLEAQSPTRAPASTQIGAGVGLDD